ncbi:MAG: hypothetical protein JWQ09_3736 [Segetibacter sp.]|nr:hypothetical protein [Segetibacter sp.]
MKKTFTLFLLGMAAIATRSIAQPVITSSVTSSPLGTVDSAYGASPTVLPGAGGASVNWDMSTVTTIFAAKLTVVDPTTTPYASTFTAANYCVKIEASSTTYNYSRMSSSGLENVALNYFGVGTGTDFTPNLRLSVPFPFNYLDSKSDTFQSTTSTTVDTVRLTYDGYGTLKTPFYSYSNVIRIKEDYGTSYSYSWYTMSPFALVMNYASTTNNYVIVTQRPSPSTAISAVPVTTETVIYPNPMSGDAVLKINASAYNNASIAISDISGRTVKQLPVTSSETIIHKDGMVPGMYFYTVQNDGVKVANGKLAVE